MRVSKKNFRISFGTATVVLLFSGLGGTAKADVVGAFGVDAATNSCGWHAQYNTATGGGLVINPGGPCTISGSAPTAPGLTAASVNISTDQGTGSQSPETGSGAAAASLSTASLHASSSATGSSPTTPAFNTFDTSSAQLWDTLTFTIPGANNTTVTNIPLFFSADGTANNPSAENWGATLQFSSSNVFCCNANEVTWESDVNGFIFSGNIGLASGSFKAGESINWLAPRVNTQTQLVEEGILSLTGPSAVVDLFANLDTKAVIGSVNFNNTAAVSFQLPSGVSYTSASGVFGATSVPEPSTFGLCAVVLAGLGIFRRRLLGK